MSALFTERRGGTVKCQQHDYDKQRSIEPRFRRTAIQGLFWLT